MATISHTANSPVQEARGPQILFSDEGGIYWLRGANLARAKKLLQLSPDQKDVGFDGQTAQIYIDDLAEQGVTVGIIRGNTMRTIHAHLLRHHFAQVALEKGVERGALQDMLGHKTEQMSRRYAGAVRQQTAAKLMPKFSPL